MEQEALKEIEEEEKKINQQRPTLVIVAQTHKKE